MHHDKIDETVLALLYLGICEHPPGGQARSWKTLDWDAMNRLHEKGLIGNPASKAQSVVLTDDGLEQAEAAFKRVFESNE